MWSVDLEKNGKDKLDRNEDVLRKVNESRNTLNVIWQQKCKWIGHVLRHDGFLLEILEEYLENQQDEGDKYSC